MQRHHHFWDKGFRTLDSFCKFLSSAEGSIGEGTMVAVLQSVFP